MSPDPHSSRITTASPMRFDRITGTEPAATQIASGKAFFMTVPDVRPRDRSEEPAVYSHTQSP